MVLVTAPSAYATMTQVGIAAAPSGTAPAQDTSVAIIAPLTGIYYEASSPSSPLFVSVGDVVHVGQVVALVEAMKVFNEIQAEIAGRVTAIMVTNGEVVQKGDVMIRIQPL